jgi:probable F420-dependent oxidoreductase
MWAMGFHVALPNDGAPEQLVELAAAAEQFGFDGVWVAEHVLPPTRHPDPSYASEYDPFVLLSFLAAHTSRVRIGTSVLVLPLRNPFIVAKQAATLDRLSGGRLELGVGVGWDSEEFDSIGASFGDRGQRADEAIGLLRQLWSGSGDGFDGKYYRYRRGDFTPIRPSGIPITVGGFSAAALRRTLRFADAWQSLYLDGAGTDQAEFARHASELKRASDGRIRTTIKRYVHTADDVDALIEEIPGWRRAGADDVVIWFGSPTEFGRLQQRFAQKVKVPA